MPVPNRGIPDTFIQYAADILADTNTGLSGPKIIKATVRYAVEYGVNLPHPTYPFEACNKRTALFENLCVFEPWQQYRIIKELCDSELDIKYSQERMQLMIKLVKGYPHLDSSDELAEVNVVIIEETRHWLRCYPKAFSLYSQALEKYKLRAFQRNLLDDLRLSLEKFLQILFSNAKSLENQIPDVGLYVSGKGGSKEFVNMFVKLLDYYTKYNNSYVKHDDAVIEDEVEFIFEITSSFMKHLLRLSDK